MISRRAPLVKTGITIAVAVACFVSPVGAQGNESIDNISEIVTSFVLLLARAWHLFAILAGKLMTNDIVMGGVLHMDVYLRQIRNIMKTLANFALGFVFLFYVIK